MKSKILRFLFGTIGSAAVIVLSACLVFGLMHLGVTLGAWIGIPFAWRPLVGLGLMLAGLCIGIGLAFALDDDTPEPEKRP